MEGTSKYLKFKKSRLESRVAATRYDAKRSLFVETRTLGTSMGYDFYTNNLSRSGLFIRSKVSSVPFRVPTLVELTVDPRGEYFEDPLALVAKVIRRVDNEDGSCDLGVMIIAECSDVSAWNQWMKYVEENQEHLFEKSSSQKQIKKFRHKPNDMGQASA